MQIDWKHAEQKKLQEAFERTAPNGGWMAVANLAVELVAARGGTMTAGELKGCLDIAAEDVPQTIDRVRQHIAAHGARIAKLEADLEIAKRKRPASFEMEKELSKALGERDNYRQKMLSEGGKFTAEMQRADRLADEVNRLMADLQTMTDLRDAYRKAGALDHDRAEKAEAQIESIRRRASEVGNVERLVTEHGLPAAMRWVVEGETAPTELRCAASECLANWSKLPSRACGFCDSCCGHARGICAAPKSYPYSPTCTHDDAASPGHLERVRVLSEAIGPLPKLGLYGPAEVAAWEAGAEAMRAACWEAVREELQHLGYVAPDRICERLKSAIEGATP